MNMKGDPQALAEACAQALWDHDKASQHLGMTRDDIAPGSATLSLTIAEWMANGHNTCHGGIIFTLADSAFAFACNSTNQRRVAQHVTLTYLNPAYVGDRLTAHAHEIAVEGRNGLYDIYVSNQHGQKVALFRGHARTIKGTVLTDMP